MDVFVGEGGKEKVGEMRGREEWREGGREGRKRESEGGREGGQSGVEGRQYIICGSPV